MKILMTGGTGLLGRAFIQRFKHYHYTVVTRTPLTVTKKLGSNVVLISSLALLTDLDQFDAVINWAGEPIIDKRWSKAHKELICQSRWQITEQLVKLFAISTHPPQVFLSGSAIGVYGHRGSTGLVESSPIQATDFPSQLCLEWEAIASRASLYTRVVLLRTGIVLTPNGGALKKMLWPFSCGLGGAVGGGKQYMSWIHYQDYINGVNYLLTNSHLNHVVNLTAPNPVTNQYFSKTLAKALHRIAIIPVPRLLLQLLLGESACLLLDSQRVIPKVLVDNGFTFDYPNLSQALIHLLSNEH